MLQQLKDFIAEHPEHKEIIVKTVIRHQEIQSEWYDDRCSICDVQLSESEKNSISPMDFSRTCARHNEYAKVFQVDTIRMRLGFPKRNFINQQTLKELL